MTNTLKGRLAGAQLLLLMAVCVLWGAGDVFAQGEPVNKAWLVDMSKNHISVETITSTIESNGIAFLPTQAVRSELASTVSADIIKILPRYFASHTTFMVCEFTCDNCGGSTNSSTVFSHALLDKIRDRKAEENSGPNQALYGKQAQSGVGPSEGPPENLPAPIVVFITGHMSKEGANFRITASLQYRNKGERPKPIGPTKEFVSNGDLRTTARTVGSWAIDSLLAEVR